MYHLHATLAAADRPAGEWSLRDATMPSKKLLQQYYEIKATARAARAASEPVDAWGLLP
jgi:hypothetical protein